MKEGENTFQQSTLFISIYFLLDWYFPISSNVPNVGSIEIFFFFKIRSGHLLRKAEPLCDWKCSDGQQSLTSSQRLTRKKGKKERKEHSSRSISSSRSVPWTPFLCLFPLFLGWSSSVPPPAAIITVRHSLRMQSLAIKRMTWFNDTCRYTFIYLLLLLLLLLLVCLAS